MCMFVFFFVVVVFFKSQYFLFDLSYCMFMVCGLPA